MSASSRGGEPAELVEFRVGARDWLHSHVPAESRPDDPVDARDYDVAWQRCLFDGGWAGVSWPAEAGGPGLSLVEQLIWHEEYAAARAPIPGVNFVGLNHAGPTVILRGDADQQAERLLPILRGEVIWCQGFSEPGAGSDLAGISTRAVVDGDDLVVNGSKIWTSYGQIAQVQELLVRTDPTAERHRGLSWLICDLATPGITIRPIKSMAGTNDFCEVFYDDVRIPLRQVVGGLNQGWSVAMSTLSFERGTAFVSQQIELAQTVDELVDLARETPTAKGGRAIDDVELAHRLAITKASVMALRAMSYAEISRSLRDGQPGAESSIIRLYFTQLQQTVYELAMDIVGQGGLALRANGSWPYRYLYSFSRTIAGGTQEIQRNIIGERFLGLPRA